MWIYNENFKQNKKIKKEQVETYLEQSWKLGRIQNWEGFFKKKEKYKQNFQNKCLHYEEQKHKYTEMYKVYCEFGFNVMVEKFGYKFSQPNFIMQCKRYVDNFKPHMGKHQKK